MEIDKRKRLRRQTSGAKVKFRIIPRLWDVERKGVPQFGKIILGFSVAALLTVLLAPSLMVSQPNYQVGDIATRDIKAPEDYLVKDVQATEKRTEAAKRGVPPVFDRDSTLISEISSRVKDAFSEANKLRGDSVKVGRGGYPQKGGKEVLETDLKSLRKEVFEERLGVDVNDSAIYTLENNGYRQEIAKYIAEVVKAVLERGLVGDDREYLSTSVYGIVVRDLVTGRVTNLTDTNTVLDGSTLGPFLKGAVVKAVPENSREFRGTVLHIAEKLIRPNLIMNRAESQARVQAAVQEVKPVYFVLKKGEIILRQGDPVTEDKLMKLQGLAPEIGINRTIFAWLGFLVLVMTILYLGWIYLTKFKHWIISNIQQLVLLSAVLVGNMLIIKGALYVAASLAENQGIVGLTSFYYAIPFALGAMLAVILFDMEVAILFSVATFILTSVLIKDNISFPLLALVGSLVASFRGKHYRQRSLILLTGVFIGLGNLALVVSADLINHTLFTADGGFDAIMGFLGGILAGFIVSGILPIFESLFNMATDIKLLELSDPNHPLLRELAVQAPGTYHHSIILGSLAEEAAKNVRANDLFARVASYYHDAGKIFKPDYFIENQQDSVSRHDKLSPTMSSLILMSHVKDGIELAREHKLPPTLIDIIQQHHGTSLISFFYNKAKEQMNQGHQQIDENDFRYHGPKPQGKEAAIVLLADSVEAASRTLDDPSPARLRNLVQRIVNHHLIDGQLDECDLSLKDLHAIVESFVRILAAIFHQRVAYPQTGEGVEEIPRSAPDLDFGPKQPKQAQSKP